MVAMRKTQTFLSNGNIRAPARNLEKSNLGGVIFGCTKITMKECLTKQLFGQSFTFWLLST